MIVYTDHRNNIFTDSLFANKRISKKLLRWALDLEDLGSRVVRVWLRGEDNILGDAPSRNPEDRDVLHTLRVPGGPVRRVIEQMFTAPSSAEEQAQMDRFLEEIDGKDCPKETKKRAVDRALARTAAAKQRAEDQALARNAAATSAEDQAQARNASKSVGDQTQPKATATDRMAAPPPCSSSLTPDRSAM